MSIIKQLNSFKVMNKIHLAEAIVKHGEFKIWSSSNTFKKGQILGNIYYGIGRIQSQVIIKASATDITLCFYCNDDSNTIFYLFMIDF